MKSKREIVAIDGPAASGKSTVARHVAERLGALYLDSGAVYRGITLKALEQRAALEDEAALAELTAKTLMDFFVEDGAVLFSMDGRRPGPELRAPRVDRAVSQVAAARGVREGVVEKLRSAADLGRLVVEGRDIGTVVFPESRHKFHLDASPAERARRRHGELTGHDPALSEGAVDEALRRRDALDRARQAAPLRVAPDAKVIDTTGLTVDEVVQQIVQAVRRSG